MKWKPVQPKQPSETSPKDPTQKPNKSTGPKRTPTMMEADSLVIEGMTLEGYTLREIATHLTGIRPYKVSHTMVHEDLLKIRARWKEEARLGHEEFVAAELKKLERREKELWKAWQRSQEDAETITTERVLIKHKGKVKQVGGKKITRKVERKIGAVAFQNALNDIEKARRELKGLDAPKKIAYTDADGTESYQPLIITGISPDQMPQPKTTK